MTLEEAIHHARMTSETRGDLCEECRKEHLQLAGWLQELQESRELINRQKADIERLSRPCFVLNHNPLSDKEMKKALKENPMTIVPVDNYTIKRIDEEGIRAEAIKEFAERLKEKSEHFWEEKENFVSEEDIDNLVKEMSMHK